MGIFFLNMMIFTDFLEEVKKDNFEDTTEVIRSRKWQGR
jgi:hypothetical protein